MRYQDFYSILIASTASLTHVQQTLRASVYPSLRDSPSVSAEKEAPNVDSDGGAWGAKVQDKIESYKVPDSVKREYWTRE